MIEVLTLVQFRLHGRIDSHVGACARLGGLVVGPVLALGMESGTSCNNVRIVHRRHNRHCAGGASVQVAEVVGQALQIVRGEIIVILQDLVVGRPRSAQEARMALDIKVELKGVDDHGVDASARLAVAAAIGALGVHGEEPGMVALLDDHIGDFWVVVGLQAVASCTDTGNLGFQHGRELALRDSVAVDQDTLRFLSTSRFLPTTIEKKKKRFNKENSNRFAWKHEEFHLRLVVLLEKLDGHVGQIGDCLSSGFLNSNGCGIASSSVVQ